VRCLFWWTNWEGRPFEERVTLWRARSAEHAAKLAEAEAREHAETVDIEYLEFFQVCRLGENGEVRDGMVVFSRQRQSDLSPEDYLDVFYDSGREHRSSR
jgi:hypothetical protein